MATKRRAPNGLGGFVETPFKRMYFSELKDDSGWTHPAIPGLVVGRKRRGEWDITHIPSGLRVSMAWPTAKEAALALEVIGYMTDWTVDKDNIPPPIKIQISNILNGLRTNLDWIKKSGSEDPHNRN